MKEVELVEKRKPREKHFLQKDGTIRAEIYNTDVHFLKNGKYEEIDNTLIKENNSFVNKNNDYKVEFKEDFKESLMKMSKDNLFINFRLKQDLNDKQLYSSKRRLIDNNIVYNINKNTSIEYKVLSNQVKESIILNNSKYEKLVFNIDTNLDLIQQNGEILAKHNDKTIFTIEKPFMIDSNNVRNDNICYKIVNTPDKCEIELILDENWLLSKERIYPVYVDPTIVNNGENINLYDTYVYPDDSKTPSGNRDILKAGVERVNGTDRVNRALIKFELPELGTGSEVIDASLELTPYISLENNKNATNYLVTVHRVIKDWDELTATFDTIGEYYDGTEIEAIIECARGYLEDKKMVTRLVGCSLTNLVKKWYKDTPNYGILLKAENETYVDDDYPAFFSKDNQVISTNPRPLLVIRYRNQNGLESYLNYKKQDFSIGSTYVNTYNGNLIGIFDVGQTLGGQMPANVKLVYNTNDVILNKATYFGQGFKLNVEQSLKIKTIDGTEYIEYVDEDGTLHYFNKNEYFYSQQIESEESYSDEDGLSLKIKIVEDNLVMTDNQGNSMTFIKRDDVYYLTEIIDSDNNKIVIDLDSHNRITKITDINKQEIIFSYETSKISIVSVDNEANINFINGVIESIQTAKGNTKFIYNENQLISTIIDPNGTSINYDYYSEKPYKVKKVTQIGLNNKIGQYFTLDYGNNATTIIDNKNRYETLIYDYAGNQQSINNLGKDENISNAYSLTMEYGGDSYDSNKNKIVNNSIPVKYIKNYLKNTSFEKDQSLFTETEGIITSYSTEYVNSGKRSLKVVSEKVGQSIEQMVSVPKGNNYTFSGYFKNMEPITISLSYINSNGDIISKEENVEFSDDFNRNDISIYYEENATTDLKISIFMNSINVVYIDDIQLEVGEIANYYNMIENSDFSDGLSDWKFEAYRNGKKIIPSGYFQTTEVNNTTALRVIMFPTNSTNFKKTFPISGNKGDLYTISFWYKNNGVEACRQYAGNKVTVFFHPTDGEADYCVVGQELNIDRDRWQFFSYRNRAPKDFDSIDIIFSQDTEANIMYITNLSFYKDVTSGDFKYDKYGNLITITDQSRQDNNLNYDKNNQLISSTSPKGTGFKYEYDNSKTSRIINTISSSGLANKIQYDNYGNPISIVTSKKKSKDIKEGTYRIRCKGTDKYLKAELNCIIAEKNDCSNTLWDIELKDDYYKINYSIIPKYHVSYDNNSIFLSEGDSNYKIYMEENDNGSYFLYVYLGEVKKYFKISESQILLSYLEKENPSYEFYIETINDLFVENKATYTDNGRFITSVIDNNDNETFYNIDEMTGLTNSIIYPNNTQTLYEYNSMKQLSLVSTGRRNISYNYNEQNLLSKIETENVTYDFTYDDFLNKKEIKINNNIVLISNEFEDNNGNLITSTYGNDDKISFSYDEFNRIITTSKIDNTYNYKYDNNGNICKIISNDKIEKYLYDVSKRICEFGYDNYKVNYKYNNDNDVISKIYKLKNVLHKLENNIDENDNLQSINLDTDIINYKYDSLDRLINKNINDKYIINFNYITKGKKTTDLIRSIQNGNNTYNYKYDNMNNIKHIYYNDEEYLKYNYNQYNELVSVENYLRNEKIEYNYDNYGNITKKVKSSLLTHEIINIDTYEYNNNWKDQLIKYNGSNILYDKIGNPIRIGDNIEISWKNGRELKNYKDTSKKLNISYKYNDEGIRESKIINDVETKYYLEDNKIIYEIKNNSIMYYLYDLTGVAGLEYNGTKYYYVKNLQNDIIGILDENYQEIVSYEYDSWGKLVSVKNQYGNEITDENNIGLINPFRYRSYYYDNETGLYYLNTRYYDPTWGRFINADGIIGAKEDIIGYNLYAYSNNNPISYVDNNGNLALPLFGVSAALAYATAATAAYYVLKQATKVTVRVVSNVLSASKTKSATTTAKREPEKQSSTVIYRMGSSTNYNLTPRVVDQNGLSFTTIQPTGKYVATTVEAVNKTMILEAVRDPKKPTHYLIVPKLRGTIYNWISTKETANESPHIYTQTLKTIIWDHKSDRGE